MFLQNYEIIRELGKGGFAKVYKAKYRLNDQYVAIKMVRMLQLISVNRFTLSIYNILD